MCCDSVLPAAESQQQANENLTLALHAARAGVWNWDFASGEIHWSPQLYELFGLDPQRWTPTLPAWQELLHPDDRAAALAQLDAVLRGGDDLNLEYRILHGDGRQRWISALGRTLLDARGQPLRMTGICVDVTERKAVEARLKGSEERFRSIMELSPDIVSIVTAEGVLAWNSPAALGVHGYTQEELTGINTFELIHPADHEQVSSAIQSLLDHPGETVSVRYRYRNKDGSYTWMEARGANQLANPHIRGVVAISRDISERKRIEEELARSRETLEEEVQERTAELTRSNTLLRREIDERRRVEADLVEQQQRQAALSQELALAAERERARIAGELHDEVGQRLILGRLKLDALESRLVDPPLVESCQELRRLLEATLDDVRSLTFQLRPPILASAGLVAALHWLAEDLRVNYQLQVAITPAALPLRLGFEVAASLFQAVRELLLNVARHAGTGQARVAVSTSGGSLQIAVSDRGLGFDPADALAGGGQRGGFGLYNLRQRLEYLGGSLQLEAREGQGCRVLIRLPLPAGEAREEP